SPPAPPPPHRAPRGGTRPPTRSPPGPSRFPRPKTGKQPARPAVIARLEPTVDDIACELGRRRRVVRRAKPHRGKRGHGRPDNPHPLLPLEEPPSCAPPARAGKHRALSPSGERVGTGGVAQPIRRAPPPDPLP